MLLEVTGSLSPEDERESVDPLSFYLQLSLPLAMAGRAGNAVPNLLID